MADDILTLSSRLHSAGLFSGLAMLDFETRRNLLFSLAAERLSAFYEHGQWLTEAQGATLAGLWLSRAKLQSPQAERRTLSDLSDTLARQIAGSLSREAGLYTAHEMMEALDPNYRSDTVFNLLDECERLLREQEGEPGTAA